MAVNRASSSPPGPAAAFANVASLFVVVQVLLAAFLHGVLSRDDPHRCQGLLQDGTWLDAPSENGTRWPYHTWQPRGCKLRQYSKADIHQCLEHRHMVFSGDSTTRQVFWAMGRLLDRNKSMEARKVAGIHESYDMDFDGIRLVQIWNPYLGIGEDTKEHHDLSYQLNLWQEEKHANVPVPDQKSAGLIMLGAGSWFVLSMLHDDAVGNFSEAFTNTTDRMNTKGLAPFGSTALTPLDGIGNEVMVAPIAVPFYDKLPGYRTEKPEGIHPGEVEDIDAWLDSVVDETRIPLLRAFPALSRDQPKAIVDPDVTGFHVVDSVAETKATILLNARCNAKLHKLNGFPYDGTCCTDYGGTTFVQSVLLGLGFLYATACVVFEALELLGRGPARPGLFSMSGCMFVTALLSCFLADRTQLLAKGSKQFISREFGVLSLLALVVGLLSVGRASPPRSSAGSVPAPSEAAAPALSRSQTEEWKGWMQAAILIYHWTGASSQLPIYICIRVMVAAYLFQTGYGHTVFFLSKKDFSFKRVAAVMLRLNLLSCALPYVMNTDYMLYYFAPLVSFWYAVVYATMAICPSYNESPLTLLGKIAVSALAVASVFLFTPVSSWVFAILARVFLIHWDLHEWQFRVSLDILIVYVGMLAGMASVRSKYWNKLLVESKLTGLVGLAVLGGYWYLTNQHFDVKQDYNAWHPYISFLPIMAYIAARNVATPFRIYFSRAFAWLGRCSLETFTLQFHLFLAADTKAVLLWDGFNGDGSLLGDRWRHLVAIVPFFLWISHRVAGATDDLVKKLTAVGTAPTEASKEANELDAEPLLPGLVGGLANTRVRGMLKQLNTEAVAGDLRIRMAGLLALMWLFNLLY